MSLWKIAREGWRPALGWVGVMGAFNAFVLLAKVETTQLMALIGLCLTHVGIRAWEKAKDVDNVPGK